MLSTTSSDSDELPLETGEPPRADLYTAGRGSGKPCPRQAAGPPAGPDPPPHSVAAAAAALSAPRGAGEPRLRVHVRSHWADGDALADAYAVGGTTTSTEWRGEQEAEAEAGTGPSLRLELGLDLLLGHQKGIAFWCSVPPSESSIPEAREGGGRCNSCCGRGYESTTTSASAPRCAFRSCLRCARARVPCCACACARAVCEPAGRVNAPVSPGVEAVGRRLDWTGVWWSSIVFRCKSRSRWRWGHIIV